jgi:hypothetical protein
LLGVGSVVVHFNPNLAACFVLMKSHLVSFQVELQLKQERENLLTGLYHAMKVFYKSARS